MDDAYDYTTPDTEIDPVSGGLRTSFPQQNSIVQSTINRNLLYTKSEVNALIQGAIVQIEGEDMFKNYKQNDVDEDTSPYLYVGMCKPNGNVWLIQRVESVGDGDVLDIKWANLSNNGLKLTYTQAWTDRASLNYNDIGALTF